MVLSGTVVEPLGGGISLEEVGHWAGGGLQALQFSSLPIYSLNLDGRGYVAPAPRLPTTTDYLPLQTRTVPTGSRHTR